MSLIVTFNSQLECHHRIAIQLGALKYLAKYGFLINITSQQQNRDAYLQTHVLCENQWDKDVWHLIETTHPHTIYMYAAISCLWHGNRCEIPVQIVISTNPEIPNIYIDIDRCNPRYPPFFSTLCTGTSPEAQWNRNWFLHAVNHLADFNHTYTSPTKDPTLSITGIYLDGDQFHTSSFMYFSSMPSFQAAIENMWKRIRCYTNHRMRSISFANTNFHDIYQAIYNASNLYKALGKKRKALLAAFNCVIDTINIILNGTQGCDNPFGQAIHVFPHNAIVIYTPTFDQLGIITADFYAQCIGHVLTHLEIVYARAK